MMNDFDYSVRVKNGSGWRKYSRVRLMISVGKEYHEGKKLVAVVNWINRNPCIEEVHVSVNDLLQRHNFEALGMSQEEAKRASLLEGSLWTARNADTLDEIRPKKFFTRWEDWFSQDGFLETQNQLLAYADQDLGFRASMDHDAHSLAERKTKRGEPVPPTLIAHSKNYIEEEMAVFAMQTASIPAAEVYPGSNLAGAEYMLALKSETKGCLPMLVEPLGHRYFTRIDFSRIEIMQPRIEQRISAQHAV